MGAVAIPTSCEVDDGRRRTQESLNASQRKDACFLLPSLTKSQYHHHRIGDFEDRLFEGAIPFCTSPMIGPINYFPIDDRRPLAAGSCRLMCPSVPIHPPSRGRESFVTYNTFTLAVANLIQRSFLFWASTIIPYNGTGI